MERAAVVRARRLGSGDDGVGACQPRAQEAKKPNILVIWGDDIGWYNISAYNLGMMGYKTPNIDRIAKEGALFTDWYGQQSCTAGRAAFITGQSPIRTGLTKVGLPGAPEGLQQVGPDHRRAAEAARLRHRPVRQEPPRRPQRAPADGARLRRVLRQPLPPERRGGAGERRLPEGPGVQASSFGPRGVLHCYATATEEAGRRPALRRLGQAEVRGHRPAHHASAWRRSTDEFLTAAEGFIDKAHQADKPFFVWWNSTRMHIWTHLKPDVAGQDRASASIPTAWSSTTAWSASCWPSSTSSASPTTPSSCTRPTTAPRR